MGGGGGGGNTTTRAEPPKYQLPYLERGLGYAQNQYDLQSGNPNSTVAPFSPETEQGLQGITNQATQGNPITGSANNLAQQTLNGDFLNSNPYLDQTFGRAALQTQNQLASQFAGSGRNIGASEGLRSQQLNDLATQIYGGNYNDERNRQMGVLGMSPQLAQGSYTDMDRLLGVGAQREGLNQQQLDAPGQQLDQFLNRVSGNMGTTNIQSGSSNRAAGILGGGMMGSQMAGNMGFGGWGQLGGGLLGGYLGGWG